MDLITLSAGEPVKVQFFFVNGNSSGGFTRKKTSEMDPGSMNPRNRKWPD